MIAALVGLLSRAHDAGLVNEDAMVELLERRLQGQPLTLTDLCVVFGVDTIHNLIGTIGPAGLAPTREDLYRAAAIAGLHGAVLFRADGSPNVDKILDGAEQTVAKLRERGVL